MPEPLADIETLQDDGELFVFRTERNGEPMLVVRPASTNVAASSAQFENALALRGVLDAAWAACPRALEHHLGKPTLLLDDPGGVLLSRLIRGPGELTTFLRFAVGAAAALRELHARGVIHRDIKPANLLVTASGGVRLFGFGIAARLPPEGSIRSPGAATVGTLAYMAPEQTGGMEHGVDARSDLYAFGVTLYELATGALPFAASDTWEWIHAHLAEQPPKVENVPGVVAAIIAKLLAKTPEERYQSAAGLEADLRRCLKEWEAHRVIEPFALGELDLADRLRIRETLYGREAELETLRAAVDRIVAGASPQLILISGQPGIGKSALGRQLVAMTAERALFATGKSAQYQLEAPYAALAQALQMLLRDILAKSDEALARWRAAVQEALGPNAQLIVNLVPELELIIGKQPAVPELQPHEARNRFQSLFRSLLAVFARREHPLVLFLDDLQWAGPASIDLLVDVLTSHELSDILVVAAYRSSDLGADSLPRAAEAIRSAGGLVKELPLSPLSISDVLSLVSDAVRCERARARSLAEVLHTKTGGNPFFAVQFLRSLSDEALLTFDRTANAWVWDLDRVRDKAITDNVVDLVNKRFDRLPPETVDVLQQMACVGSSVGAETLAAVCGVTVEKLADLLADALTAGLVLDRTATYAFAHDRVHEAAYALLPEAERAAAHLRIGHLLWSRTPPQEIDQQIFDIADQLARGASLIKGRRDQLRVAELQLAAGRRAWAATAYAFALKYLAAARELLGDDAWEQHYSLAFAVELSTAQCEFLTSAPAAEQRLASLSSRAIGLVDLAAVTSLRVTLDLTLNKSERALEVGIEYLRRVGFDWKIIPSEEEVVAEHDRMWSLLGGRPIEAIADLPPMKDVVWKGVMDVLCSMIQLAVFLSPRLHQLCLLRMANLSLAHGYCGTSCVAYAQLSLVLGPVFKNYQAGYRLCQTAFEIVERDRLTEWRARVYLLLAYHVLPYTHHIQQTLALLRRGSDAARESGDLLFSTYNETHIISTRLALGHPLADVEREANGFLARVRQMRFGLLIDCYAGQLLMICALRGEAPQYQALGQSDEASLEQHFAEDSSRAIAACWYWIRKLQALVFSNDAAAAVEAARRAQEFLWTTPTMLEIAEYQFYAALAHAAAGDASAVGPHRAQLATWAETSPETFANRLALVDAELARLDQRWFDAERAYEQAIELSRRNQFVHHEGLAAELAARFYAGRGLSTVATAYLRNARSCYARWGADSRVRALDHAHPELYEVRPTKATTTGDVPLGQLDLATVVEMLQAVSGEIALDRLLRRLMTLVVEYAGAGRALLISPVAGASNMSLAAREEMRIVAEAVARQRGAKVSLHQKPISAAEVPESILNYVVRTRDSVILQDPLQASPFSGDEYLRRARVRSVLCLPLVKRTRLTGVLYLENKLTSHVFSAERSEVLRLVASQAAISLENARLYAELQQAGLYLAEAQRLSHTGSFGWQPSSGEIIWSDETFAIFGYDRGTKPTIELVMARVHPEDRTRVQRHVERVVRQRADWQIEHRLLMPDGSIKHLQVVSRQAQGVGYVGAVMDVTAARLAEKSAHEARAFQLANERLALALRGSNVGVWDFDLRNHSIRDAPVHSVNLWEPMGYEADAESAGSGSERYHPERYHPDDRERVGRVVDDYLASKSAAFEVEWRLRHKDGSYRWWLYRGAAVRDVGGKPIRFLGSSVDITDRKKLEEELRHAKDAAETANRAKDQFLANVSHEIRTPMNAILGMTELALDASPSEQQRLSLSTVKTAAENLLVIIDDLLDFAKIEAGKVELAAEVFSLRQVLRECMRALALRAHRKRLELICDVAPDVPNDVVGDAVRLRQVLLNLVGNAIKFTPGGEIVVSVEVAGGGHRFSVRDTGIGIAPQRQQAIFCAFEQADGSAARRYGGTGLGLTIAARLVELMGGRIEVHSELGRGSTFTFTANLKAVTARPVHPPAAKLQGMPVLLADDNASTQKVLERWLRSWGMEPTVANDGPAALTALGEGRYPVAVVDAEMDGLAALPARSATRLVLLGAIELPEALARFKDLGGDAHVAKPSMPDELQAAILLALEGRQPAAAQAAAPCAASRCLRILVAEDNDLNQRLMRQLLATRGHQVTIAADGRQALAHVESSPFDALLLDVHLPEIDGFEVVKAIRQRERETGRHLHIVATTARARQSDREACLAAGMDDFLPKPLAAAALWAALDRVVREAAPSSLIDAPVLLSACGQNPETLARISEALQASLPDELSAAERALQQRDAPLLRETAHKLNGLVSPFSSVVGALASQLEDCAARDDLRVSTLMEKLVANASELRRQVGAVSLDALRVAAGRLTLERRD